MNDFIQGTQKIYSSPEECMNELLEKVSKTYSEEEIQFVKKAYEIANAAHEGQLRLSGEPYITHPLNVAMILVKLGMDEASVVAAILHDTVEDTTLTYEQVKELLEINKNELNERIKKWDLRQIDSLVLGRKTSVFSLIAE